MITAGIVTFHTPLPMLEAAITSVHACRLPVELIIVDNTPGTEYFARLQALKNIRCIKSPVNGGYGYGHNLACKAAPPAPYHLILNPDVVVQPGCLETMVALMEKEPAVGMTVPKIHFPDGRLQPLNRRDPTLLDLGLRRFVPPRWQAWQPIRRRMEHFVMMDYGYDTPYDVPNASGCCMLVRRAVFDAVGGFDERFFMYMEDSDLTRRIRALARVRYCPEAAIIHHWGRGSHTSFPLMLAMVRSAWKYFQKWGWQWY